MECVLTTTAAPCLSATPPGVSQTGDARGEAPPVLGAIPSSRPPSRLRLICLILLPILLLPVLCVVGIASYFHLGSSTRALGSAVMESVPGEWHKQFAVNVGYVTVGLVRFGSAFFRLPPEARAALQALDGGEVGVYEVKGETLHPDYAAILGAADKAMRRRGWERVVGVSDGSQCRGGLCARQKSWQRHLVLRRGSRRPEPHRRFSARQHLTAARTRAEAPPRERPLRGQILVRVFPAGDGRKV